MSTPFDEQIIWWHWRGQSVPEETIGQLAEAIQFRTPNAKALALKTSNGKDWQGHFADTKAAMAITGLESIRNWVDELAARDLQTHLWCVLHGKDIASETTKVIEACLVSGVKSMILDIEASERYFGSHPPEVVREIITTIRAGIPQGFHLGLCFFARENEPTAIHIHEWLPHVQSLHPMVYHWDFSNGSSRPEPYLDEAFDLVRPYGLPIIPLLETYPDPTSGTNVPAEHITTAGTYAFSKGATAISLFRWGDGGATAVDAVSRIAIKPTGKVL